MEFNAACLDSQNPFSASIIPGNFSHFLIHLLDLLMGNSARQELFRNILRSLHLQVTETPQTKPNISEIFLYSDSATLKNITSTLSEMNKDMTFDNSQQPTLQVRTPFSYPKHLLVLY